MRTRSYTDSLRTMVPATPDQEEMEIVREEPSELLRWIIARVLLDEDTGLAREWLEEQERALEVATDAPHRELLFRAMLAAIRVLLGKPADEHLDKLHTLAKGSAGLDPSRLEREDSAYTRLAIAAVRGITTELDAARAAALVVPPPQRNEVRLFESLYLTSRESGADRLSDLATAAGRVLAREVTFGAPFDPLAPLVLCFEARATRDGKNAAAALRGAVVTFEREASGGAVGEGPLEDDDVRLELDESELVLQLTVGGKGELTTGAHELKHLITLLPRALDSARQLKGAAGKRIRDALANPGTTLTGIVATGSAVTVAPKYREGFQRRFLVANEWARALVPGIRASAQLVFREAAPARRTAGSRRAGSRRPPSGRGK